MDTGAAYPAGPPWFRWERRGRRWLSLGVTGAKLVLWTLPRCGCPIVPYVRNRSKLRIARLRAGRMCRRFAQTMPPAGRGESVESRPLPTQVEWIQASVYRCAGLRQIGRRSSRGGISAPIPDQFSSRVRLVPDGHVARPAGSHGAPPDQGGVCLPAGLSDLTERFPSQLGGTRGTPGTPSINAGRSQAADHSLEERGVPRAWPGRANDAERR